MSHKLDIGPSYGMLLDVSQFYRGNSCPVLEMKTWWQSKFVLHFSVLRFLLRWTLPSITDMSCIFTGSHTETAVTLGLYGILHSGRNVGNLRMCPSGLDLGCWESTMTFRHAAAKQLVCSLKNKKPTRCHLLFYCTSYRLNMFRALLCPSSAVHDYNVDYHIGRSILGLL